MPQKNLLELFLLSEHKLLLAALSPSQQKEEMLLQQSLALQPNNANSLYLYGHCLLKRNKSQQGNKLIKKAESLNNQYYSSKKKTPKIIKLQVKANFENLIQAIKHNPEPTKIKWGNIISKFTSNKGLNSCERVLELLQKLDILQLMEFASPSQFGLAYYHLGKYDLAFRSYSLELENNTNSLTCRNLAILEYLRQNYELCFELGVKAISLSTKKCGQSIMICSYALSKLNQIKQALQHIESSIEDLSNSTIYRFKKISILIAHYPERIQEILKQIQQIGRINKTSFDYSYFYSSNSVISNQTWHFINDYYVSWREQGEFWTILLEKLCMLALHGIKQQQRVTKQLRKMMEQFMLAKGLERKPPTEELKVEKPQDWVDFDDLFS